MSRVGSTSSEARWVTASGWSRPARNGDQRAAVVPGQREPLVTQRRASATMSAAMVRLAYGVGSVSAGLSLSP